MKRCLLFLAVLTLLCSGCGSECSPDGHRVLVAPETETLLPLIQALTESGYECGWVKEGEVAWVKHEGLSGKLVLRHFPQLKAVAITRVFSKKKKAKVTEDFLIRLNYLNATGYLKGYLDLDLDLWLQAFYPMDTLLDREDFGAFLVRFDGLTLEVAKSFSKYLELGK